jgi:hypothetical protein
MCTMNSHDFFMKKVSAIGVIIVLLTGCTGDAILDAIKQDLDPPIRYDEVNDAQKGHTAYFKLADSGQTQSYTVTHGEDSDYSNLPSLTFVDNLNGTITDSVTGLIWTKCSMKSGSQMDESSNCSNTHDVYYWQDAMNSCDNLVFGGRDDWKLPTYAEMVSIVDFGRVGNNMPAIDETYFPNTEYTNYYDKGMAGIRAYIASSLADIKLYWTSTEWTDWGISVVVDFEDGYNNALDQDDDNNKNYVRCVANTK